MSEVQGGEDDNLPKWRSSKWLNRLLLFISIGVVLNLGISLWGTDWNAFKNLNSLQPGWLLLAAILALSPWLLHASRLKLWGWFLGMPLRFREGLQIAVATDLGAAITPTVVGGAPLKIGLLMQKGWRAGVAASLITINTLEDIAFFLLIIPISLYASSAGESPLLEQFSHVLSERYPYIILVLFGLLVILYFITKLESIRLGKWWEWIKNKWKYFSQDVIKVFALIKRQGISVLLFSIVLNVIQWSLRFSVLLAIVKGLGIQVSYMEIFLIEWLVFLSMAIVPTPGATGGAEAAFYYVYRSFFPANLIGIIVGAWRILTYYLILITGVIVLRLGLMQVE